MRMKYTAALAGLLWAGAAHAQTSVVLIEACNAVQAADKRLECLKAAMGATAAAPKDAAIDTLEQAFGSMQAGLGVGMSYRDYQAAVLDLARALAVYKLKAGGLPSNLLEQSLAAYSDAGTLWIKSIEFYANRDNALTYPRALPIDGNNLLWLVQKYTLAVSDAGFPGRGLGLPVDATRSQIWAMARHMAERGIREIRNPASMLPVVPAVSLQDADIAAAQALAKDKQCQEAPQVERTGLAGVDTLFAAACTDGKQLQIACASGICRVLAQPAR